MQTHWYAKVFGYAQFAIMFAAQVASHNPRGVIGWLTTAASGIAALGIHAASSTDGSK